MTRNTTFFFIILNSSILWQCYVKHFVLLNLIHSNPVGEIVFFIHITDGGTHIWKYY